jgi:Uncharacterized Fe-S center protein
MKKILFMFALAVGLASCNGNAQSNKSAEEIVSNDVSKVFFMKDITPENLMKLYEALGSPATGKVGVKIHMGEPGGNHFLKPAFVKDFVSSINGTFIDACTAYGGRRSTPKDHIKVAEEHGFTAVAPVDILDADGEIALPIEGGKHLKEVLVGSHFTDYDYIVVLTHFKGHAMGGFGGSLKNISIGIASVAGKALVHTAGASSTNAFAPVKQEDFIESMAEAAKGMIEQFKGRILYINVMNNLSVDCDCNSNPADPSMHDVGILASFDPVALDKACVDLVYASEDHGKIHLVERIESRKGTVILDHAEQLGVGSQKYELIKLDK